MKTGTYIVDRLLPAFVKQAAAAQSIACETLSDDWVLRLQRDGVIRWILGYQFDVNKAAASALAQDKVATHLLLKHADIPSVEHVLVRSVPDEALSPDRFTSALADTPFVLKPLDGTGGRGVQLVPDATAAIAAIQTSGEVAWAASPYYDITNEYRVIMLDRSALVIYEKVHPTMHHGIRFYNLGLGAQAIDIADPMVADQLSVLADTACEAANLALASVDIVRLSDGSLRVLEINDGIMMENYARQSATYKKRAATVYDAIVQAMFR